MYLGRLVELAPTETLFARPAASLHAHAARRDPRPRDDRPPAHAGRGRGAEPAQSAAAAAPSIRAARSPTSAARSSGRRRCRSRAARSPVTASRKAASRSRNGATHWTAGARPERSRRLQPAHDHEHAGCAQFTRAHMHRLCLTTRLLTYDPLPFYSSIRRVRMPVINRIASFHKDMTAWRHDIHSHPETAFEEVRTADIVAEKLKSFGIEVHRGLAKTGVVGVLRSGNSKRAIGLRADMDALDVHETNEFAHKSTIPGKMHACGHDGHTVMLLGAAKYLAETKNFDGTVYFIFQPAEENEGGGRVMVEEGLFDKFPCRGRLRHAQHPGHPGRPLRRPSRPDDGRLRHLRGRDEGRRRARRDAASRHRPGGGRLAHRHGAAVDRGAQPRPDGHRGGLDHPDPCRRHLERDPAGMRAARHRAHLQEAGAGHDRGQDREDRAQRRGGLRRRGHQVALRAALPGDRQHPAGDRVRGAGRLGAGRRWRTSTATRRRPWAARTSPGCC